MWMRWHPRYTPYGLWLRHNQLIEERQPGCLYPGYANSIILTCDNGIAGTIITTSLVGIMLKNLKLVVMVNPAILNNRSTQMRIAGIKQFTLLFLCM